ncbi:hypothetical protein NB647_01050 [Oxalobacter aliiformigenes]|uniref:BPSS1780 family membrane protein n=1 Tax=Oxalobacter aliiformigenes TaxID=2946593 RepID=UPI0022AEE129|nr:BPSS1780 family membrane protein [Oxalobacter aliiformigenes]WAV89449.1 hypothetical protein NB647_01050 [Oxalobacter aliiformigenes]
MNLLKARTGWDWILGGLTLFRKRPFFLTNLFFIYLISLILLSMIPFIGQILPILIAPVFTFLFMYVCFSIDIGRQITFRECFEVLDRTIIWRLVMVGGVYLIFGLFAVGLSFLVEGGNLFFLFVQSSPDKLPSPDLGGMFIALGLIFIVYIPFAMATWFAAPLIGWKKMGFGKALFYSFFTVVREYRPFVVYMFSWVFGFILLNLASGLLNILIGRSAAAFIAFILSVIISVWMYCSFYPTYRDIFGRPDSNL